MSNSNLDVSTNVTQASSLKAPASKNACDTIFLGPYEDIEITERNLPHWHQNRSVYFVTFHLADSIPEEKSEQLRAEREQWLRTHKEPYSEAELQDYHRLFSAKIEELLNAGHGSCCLSDPKNAEIVANALKHFDKERYILDEWVIMPNHVHVLVSPIGDNTLTRITHSWKSYTANEINKRMGLSGQVWMHESYDHIVRNEKSLNYIREYIRNNPAKARIEVTQAFSLKSPASKDACDTLIRNCTINDADAIAGIYNYYIENTTITFEEMPLTPKDIKKRIETVTQKYPYLVYEDKGKIIGYAYAGEFRSRSAYRFTVESSVYLDSSSHKKGIGSMLYHELIERVKALKLHCIVGGIAMPNEPSINLHKKFGFEKVGRFKEVGYKFNQWIDVEYWQLILS